MLPKYLNAIQVKTFKKQERQETVSWLRDGEKDPGRSLENYRETGKLDNISSIWQDSQKTDFKDRDLRLAIKK